MLFILAFISLSFIRCSESNIKDQFDENAVYSVQEATDILTKASYDLAANGSWINSETLPILERSALKLQKTATVSDIPQSIRIKTENGDIIDYLVVIEPYRSAQTNLSKSLSGGTYYVALDPDQFYRPEDPDEELWTSRPPLEIPVYYYDGVSSTPVSTTITLNHGQSPSEPIFFITLRENQEGGMNKTAVVPGTYLAYYGLDLRYDTDDNNEEFEAYFANGIDPINNPFNPTTTHMFDGNARNDASGVLRNYPDIDYIEFGNEWDVPNGQEIAMWNFANGICRLSPIEDDAYVGQYARSGNPGSLSSINIDYYDLNDNYVKFNIRSNFQISQYSSKNDDRYRSAGITNITLDNVNLRIPSGSPYFQTDQAYGLKLYNVNWKLGKVIRN